ncbi:hypothetical protein [Urbifossiella limnaea]|uniref:Uncharacterized protein n=1 Tax=Urbifossiella limnaea TaxID=2528023 RepID=A0A517XW16_9BACT|nr:hypothetical protein [Urbifossiella limnaea]QDU21712.1 hypothetical protein ETAA1_36850 [Urbifossiella limnaea]
MSVTDHVRAYHDRLAGDEHHRLRSWEHCFRYFRRVGPTGLADDRDTAALQLGFYLASWGMYRGSTFLLQRAYTVHRPVIDCLAEPRFQHLWQREFGAGQHDDELRQLVFDAVAAVRRAYAPFGEATDTLVTKVLLGTIGCLPATDRYFLIGFKGDGNSYSVLNAAFVDRLLLFSRDNAADLQCEQDRIEMQGGLRYPVMKLVDMYFWQRGRELDSSPEPGSE